MLRRHKDVYGMLKDNGQMIEETEYRHVLYVEDHVTSPQIIIYRPTAVRICRRRKSHSWSYLWGHNPTVIEFFVHFFVLNGTLSYKPEVQNDEIPMNLGMFDDALQQQIIRKICYRSFQIGIIRFFLKRHVDDFLWRPFWPSGRMGYHAAAGFSECEKVIEGNKQIT